MYPSDYIYTYALGVDTKDKCFKYGYNCNEGDKTAGWIFNSNKNDNATVVTAQWTLAPVSSGSNYVFSVGTTGFVYNGYVSFTFGARPVAYLISDIYMLDGDGSESNPYVIGN